MNLDRKIRAAIVCGNKYGFRSVYVPVLRQISCFAEVDVIVLDYPESASLDDLIVPLREAGTIRRFYLIPSDRLWLRHQRGVLAVGRAIAREGLDVLIVDVDFPVMHRHLIAAARRTRAHVVALQKEIPTQLLQAYRSAFGAGVADQSDALRHDRVTAPWWSLPIKAARLAWLLTRRRVGTVVSFGVLPLVLTGHPFRLSAADRLRFVSTRVDAAIVFTEQIRAALQSFVPGLSVAVARHPIGEMCRCNHQPRRAVLVMLGGPWRHYVTRDNPASAMEQRWVDVIRRAVDLMHFESVHLRPHPREAEDHPQRLAERLRAAGLGVELLTSSNTTIASIICDYAGAIGSFSGALAEAATACRRAFVIAIEGVEKPDDVIAEEFFEGVVRKPRGALLEQSDFVRLADHQSHRPSVGETLRAILHAA